MADTTYQGSCLCGAVRFTVTMAPPEKAYACNCSICRRAGWLLAFLPGRDFAQTSGKDLLTDYQFGKKHLHHTFCRVCGIRAFSNGLDPKGNPTVAVNLRCLDGFDATKLPVETFDGASI
jgi:hypothetical protein